MALRPPQRGVATHSLPPLYKRTAWGPTSPGPEVASLSTEAKPSFWFFHIVVFPIRQFLKEQTLPPQSVPSPASRSHQGVFEGFGRFYLLLW